MKFPEYKIIAQEQTVETHNIDVEINVSADLDFFDGHFDQVAILPAVAQLFMVKKLADKHLSVNGSFAGLRQIKFKSPIKPNPRTILFIEHKVAQNQLFFKYEHLGQLKSKGILQFEQQVST